MMIGPDLALDDNGDLLVDETGAGRQIISVRQSLRIRLRFFRAEWFLDTSVGIPYFQRIFVKKPNLDHVRAYFRNTIATTEGVQAIRSLSLDYDEATRVLRVEFGVDTIEGFIEGLEVLPP